MLTVAGGEGEPTVVQQTFAEVTRPDGFVLESPFPGGDTREEHRFVERDDHVEWRQRVVATTDDIPRKQWALLTIGAPAMRRQAEADFVAAFAAMQRFLIAERGYDGARWDA